MAVGCQVDEGAIARLSQAGHEVASLSHVTVGRRCPLAAETWASESSECCGARGMSQLCVRYRHRPRLRSHGSEECLKWVQQTAVVFFESGVIKGTMMTTAASRVVQPSTTVWRAYLQVSAAEHRTPARSMCDHLLPISRGAYGFDEAVA